MPKWITRRVERIVHQRMRETPVLLLQGPRTVGKSTLLRTLAERHRAHVVDLDDPAVRDAAVDDPALFVSGPGPVFIDEYQHVPELLDAIKSELNRDGSPGRFVIAGSTRFAALPLVSQSLTGRLHRIELHPFSQGEIDAKHESLIETLFEDPASAVCPAASTTTRDDYVRRVVRGGLPMALAGSDAARDRWFDDYIALCLERDLLEPGRVRQPGALAPLLRRVATQTAQVLNMSRAGDAVGLPATTAADYIRLFEASFLVRLLPAWGRTARVASTARPKAHMVDSGVAARLLRLPPARLGRLEPAALQQFGHLFETFVVGEVLKQASWLEHQPNVGHWRNRDGTEVDLVLENGHDGAIIGVEVKAGTRLRPADRRGLEGLRRLAGDRFMAGVIFHTGPHCSRLDDTGRLIGLPADRLWTPDAFEPIDQSHR
ncbi:ATP-binding protein [Candidatus Poriferisodalis sp.]|uniref:ATP-binding protein n=1 Tax=Candidatus Poriferisodalis sp. TaxID=3101277 RepID=UPI003B0241BA